MAPQHTRTSQYFACTRVRQASSAHQTRAYFHESHHIGLDRSETEDRTGNKAHSVGTTSAQQGRLKPTASTGQVIVLVMAIFSMPAVWAETHHSTLYTDSGFAKRLPWQLAWTPK